MKSRRIALAAGAAGGGILAAAFLQPALAFADDYSIVPDATAEAYKALDGLPPYDQLISGLQGYDFKDLTTGATGTFNGVSLNDVDTYGLSNQEILVGDSAPGSAVTGPVPASGSLFDTFNYGSGFRELYTDVVNPGGTNTITETLQTPFGSFNIPTTFDASAAVTPAVFNDPVNSSIADYSFVPNADAPEFVNYLTAQPNSYQTVSGNDQLYDVNNSAGNPTGASFDGTWSHQVTSLGHTNQEILVTGGQNGVDAPATGSFFDTDNYGSGFQNVYTDIAGTGTGGNTITDTLVTPFGSFNVPTTFDATATLKPAEFTFPTNSTDAGFSYVPDADSPNTITAIDGQAPSGQSVSSLQVYDVNNGTTPDGHFEGTSINTITGLGSNQEILVTGGQSGIDAPGTGSIFDTDSFGSGFTNVYTDVVGAGGTTTITDTFITPFGDFNIPTAFDATLALPAAEFLQTASSTAAAELAAAMNPADFTGLFAELGTLWTSLF